MIELSVLSSWKEMVKCQFEKRISKLKQNFKKPTVKVLRNASVKECLSDLHNKYVFIPADKAQNNIIIICKRYCIETLINSDYSGWGGGGGGNAPPTDFCLSVIKRFAED